MIENENENVTDSARELKDMLVSEKEETQVPGDVPVIQYEKDNDMEISIKKAENGYVVSVNYDNKIIANDEDDVLRIIKELLT